MTQPITDLSEQCRRCGERWTLVRSLLEAVKPKELDCPGFSLKHWFWRKKQNLKHVANAIYGLFAIGHKVGYISYLRFVFTTKWAWY